jgi:hypothetical protein
MRGAILAFLLLCGVESACGPVAYTTNVTLRATAAVDKAREVNAVRFAPYFWTLAVEYLQQARIEAAHADFHAANRFGRKAAEAGERAYRESVRARKAPARDPDGATP